MVCWTTLHVYEFKRKVTLHVKFISVLGRLQNKSLLMGNIVLAISCVSALFYVLAEDCGLEQILKCFWFF